ncbi:hypothetical protein [Aeromonas media]|uniref:hypothetical protein n=1 Tax=Aeromonas media TaxID=651 RepID=UPI003D22AEC1
MALASAERIRNKRIRDNRKLKSFHQFMFEIGEHHKLEAGKVVADLCEQLQIESLEVTALFKECFQIESTNNNHLCESIVKMTRDRALQQTFWRFLKELERWHDKNINKIIDKRIKELKK